jgi:hypothetical protein
MTIRHTLLAKGYLPKELPPAFFSGDFSTYATTKAGRQKLEQYRPPDNLTECVSYRLAVPSEEYRLLRIPHPATFTCLVGEVTKAFRRLLTKAGVSSFARSRPVYTTADYRAIRPLIDPANISRDRALSRSGASFLVKADVSQYYPSLYTHAVGWAIDKKLRQKPNWRNTRLLGKRVDQLLMDMQGKVSQGIPIGNDVSFLLGEIVLGQVDSALRHHGRRAFRWYDDYEISCDTLHDAEVALAQLRAELATFNLRLNARKTSISKLPLPSGEGYMQALAQTARLAHASPHRMVEHFDAAFSLRQEHPGEPVLMQAIGLLFRIATPTEQVLRVAESCISQSILAEPGCAQKVFALTTFWLLNKAAVSLDALRATIERVILRHDSIGPSSDLCWSLAFCIDNNLALSRKVAKVLSRFHDDCTAIQALHASAKGLLPYGFSSRSIERELGTATPDGPHWLALYESVRHNFLPSLTHSFTQNSLFADMLQRRVSFYREQVPSYATVVHQGGAPQWLTTAWLSAQSTVEDASEVPADATRGALADQVRKDAQQIAQGQTIADVIEALLDQIPRERVEADATPYS